MENNHNRVLNELEKMIKSLEDELLAKYAQIDKGKYFHIEVAYIQGKIQGLITAISTLIE